MSLVDSLQPETRLLDKQRGRERFVGGVGRQDTEADSAEAIGNDAPEAPR